MAKTLTRYVVVQAVEDTEGRVAWRELVLRQEARSPEDAIKAAVRAAGIDSPGVYQFRAVPERSWKAVVEMTVEERLDMRFTRSPLSTPDSEPAAPVMPAPAKKRSRA